MKPADFRRTEGLERPLVASLTTFRPIRPWADLSGSRIPVGPDEDDSRGRLRPLARATATLGSR